MPSPEQSIFFLTQLDPRAAIKGSRDPLGFQPLWTSFGRKVVGNLTTVTSSLRNFTTLLLGLYFTDRALASGNHDEGERANLFLKFEQLAAFSRNAYHEGEDENAESPRGFRRVKRKLSEGKGRVQISSAGEHQILSSQKTYGIWGLFTVAARQSGLVEQQENRLTPRAHEFVEREYLPHLSYTGSKDGAEVLRFLTKDSAFEPKGKDKRLGMALSGLLGHRVTHRERDFYTRTLVLGAEDGCDYTAGRQRQLWENISEINDAGHFEWDKPFGYEELTEVTKRADAKGQATLAGALGAIGLMEPALAAAGSLFGFMLMRNGSSLNSVGAEVRSAWGKHVRHISADRFEELRPAIQVQLTGDSADRVILMARMLCKGDYEGFARTAVEQNAEVMRARGGAPWVIVENNKLKVRLREESGGLPPAKELKRLWTNTYFINSLKSVGITVMGRHS